MVGCGVEIDGNDKRQNPPDAARGVDAATGDATSPDADATTTVTAACMAKGYVANGTSLYRTSATARAWLDAEAECAADVAGATHLVVLSSMTEADFIKTKLGWVGLSDRVTENTFVNVTAEPNDVRPWANDQPDNGSGDENCVQMKAAGLDDDQCDEAHAYTCECDGRAPTP